MKKRILYLLITTVVLTSCKEQKTNNELAQKKIYQLTNANINAEGVFLFSGENEIIANWTAQEEQKKETILMFSFFNKENKTFSEPIKITPAKGLQIHSESMAKVAITKSGVLFAFFRIKSKKSKSMYDGTLYYTTSTDRGQNWSHKKKLVTDEKSTSQSFYDITQLPDGELGIIWLDNRKLHKDRKGQTLYFTKTNKNLEFNKEIALEGSVCQCCRTDIEIDKNNTIHIAFRNIIEPVELGYPKFLMQSETEIRDMYYISSKDNGNTFTKAIPISDDNWQVNGCPHTGPSVAHIYQTTGAVWFTGANDDMGLFFSSKYDTSFNERILVSKEGKHPQMIATNGKFYIAYEEYYEANGKGYSKIILEERSSKNILKSLEISSPKTNNNHAVLKRVNENELVISWINTDIRNAAVQYNVIQL